MKKMFSVLISLGLVFLLMSILLSACGQTKPSTSEPSNSPTSATLDGQALMQQRCSVCHSTNRISQSSRTSDQWAALVDAMISRGAQLNSTERQMLIDYLAQTYP